MNQNSQSHDVELRVPMTSDLPFIQWLWSDPETMKAVGGPFYMSDDQAQRWFTAMIDPGQPTDCYRLIFNIKNEPVGEISFHQLNPNTMTAELNIKIASANRGKGYAKKALIQFLDYFFNQLGGRVMLDDVALDNEEGQNLLLRFGFEHDPGIDGVFRLFMTREQYHRLHTARDCLEHPPRANTEYSEQQGFAAFFRQFSEPQQNPASKPHPHPPC